ERVVGRVDRAVGEPPRDRRVGPVEALGERCAPREQLARAARPVRRKVLADGVVGAGLDVGLRGELRARLEPAPFREQVLQGGLVRLGHDSSTASSTRVRTCSAPFPRSTLVAPGDLRETCPTRPRATKVPRPGATPRPAWTYPERLRASHLRRVPTD